MRWTILYALLLLYGCSESGKIHYDARRFQQHLPSEKGIIVPCTRCPIFDEPIRKLAEKGKIPADIPLYGDPYCVKDIGRQYFTVLTADTLDRISLDFYNVVLFKKTSSGKVQFRLIKLEEYAQIPSLVEKFFHP